MPMFSLLTQRNTACRCSKVFAAPVRLWMNWPLWGGLLAILLLSKHAWVLFALDEHPTPSSTVVTQSQSTQVEQLFGVVDSASLNGIRPIGIFASRKNGFAVIKTETGQIGVGLGGFVAPGIRLIETHPDYVVLERNGIQQRVDLSKESIAADSVIQIQGITPTQEASGHAVPEQNLEQNFDQFTQEQRKILQQQHQELLRGMH